MINMQNKMDIMKKIKSCLWKRLSRKHYIEIK